MKIVSLTSRCPHIVSDGTTLRVKNILEQAARRPGTTAHVVAPLGSAEADAAQQWSRHTGVVLHTFNKTSDDEWDGRQRESFKQEVPAILASITRSGDPEPVRIIVHAWQAAVDLSGCAGAQTWTADLIDEIGPRIFSMATRCLLQGKIKRSLWALNNWRAYRTDMVRTVKGYRNAIVVAHDDAQRLRSIVPNLPVSVIPNGVSMQSCAGRSAVAREKTVLFHGVYSYEPNEDAAMYLINRIAPQFSRHLPDWRLILAGRTPTAAMTAAASRCHNVTVAADVPDMGALLLTAGIGIYPVFVRTGIQNKVLEALSYGLPVVTTTGVAGVFSSIDEGASACINTASSVREFVCNTESLARDSSRRQLMSNAGIEYVRRVFDWEGVTEKVIAL